MWMFSRPVRFSSTAAYWPASPMVRRTASAWVTTSRPRTAAASRVGTEDGGEDAHDGRLARPVRSEQPEHGAGLHLKGDAVERPDVAAREDLDQVVGLHRQGRVRRISHYPRNLVIKLFMCQDNGRARSWPSSCAEITGILGAASEFNEDLAKKLKLSRTDMRCLELIGRLGPLTAGRLAEESGLTTGAVTFILDRLEEAGMVTRRRDTEDRRRVWVEIVPAAQERLQCLQQPVAEEMRQVAQRFKADELASCARLHAPGKGGLRAPGHGAVTGDAKSPDGDPGGGTER